jgi:phosphoribosyl 1,2-cyclic phosphodiesterase
MAVHFHVLASGSAGNCSLLEIDGFGLLIDLGLGPRQLAGRLPAIWDRVHAALLTHVHTDHWNENTLNHLAKRRIPLYCHAQHSAALRPENAAFAALADARLVRHYRAAVPMTIDTSIRCEPISVPHDGGLTFGFRIEATRNLFGQSWALAYATDLGSWDGNLAARLADVDVLALEFNHDVGMQYASGRSPHLIRRVLGDRGHLSNLQAASLLAEVLKRSAPGRLKHVIQLHLSRQCNRRELALDVADAVVRKHGAVLRLHTAEQDTAGPRIAIGEAEHKFSAV